MQHVPLCQMLLLSPNSPSKSSCSIRGPCCKHFPLLQKNHTTFRWETPTWSFDCSGSNISNELLCNNFTNIFFLIFHIALCGQFAVFCFVTSFWQPGKKSLLPQLPRGSSGKLYHCTAHIRFMYIYVYLYIDVLTHHHFKV